MAETSIVYVQKRKTQGKLKANGFTVYVYSLVQKELYQLLRLLVHIQ